jgi:hypothetical protein
MSREWVFAYQVYKLQTSCTESVYCTVSVSSLSYSFFPLYTYYCISKKIEAFPPLVARSLDVQRLRLVCFVHFVLINTYVYEIVQVRIRTQNPIKKTLRQRGTSNIIVFLEDFLVTREALNDQSPGTHAIYNQCDTRRIEFDGLGSFTSEFDSRDPKQFSLMDAMRACFLQQYRGQQCKLF